MLFTFASNVGSVVVYGSEDKNRCLWFSVNKTLAKYTISTVLVKYGRVEDFDDVSSNSLHCAVSLLVSLLKGIGVEVDMIDLFKQLKFILKYDSVVRRRKRRESK